MKLSSKAESEFEVRLRGQPIRPVPAEWRDEILRNAIREGAVPGESGSPSNRRVPGPASMSRPWFALPRLGWLGLAATWLLILGLHVASQPEPLSDLAGKRPTISEAWTAWSENQRELARLLETEPPFPRPRPEANRPPRERSCLPVLLPLA
jgi:hypothetical protein